MYTAEMAKKDAAGNDSELDDRIKSAVKEANYRGHRTTSIRVYIEDAFVHNIREELEKRGFTNVDVPYIILKGDVEFSW